MDQVRRQRRQRNWGLILILRTLFNPAFFPQREKSCRVPPGPGQAFAWGIRQFTCRTWIIRLAAHVSCLQAGSVSNREASTIIFLILLCEEGSRLLVRIFLINFSF
uniref:Uncharacterized protein n=1 Tax=Rhizoctonia solani TaxID=456999 RepID=N0ABZ3_9AGAM|nr:hypothetical protein RSOL_m01460 [Rhizoctonia solani]AGK45456.1 hypothetical protein RSOL_m01460 [Rhizoctonia solani]